jgi:AraC-like DNA-binding protein
VSQNCAVQVRFYKPPPELQRYFTTFHTAEITVADGGQIQDFLHPEWGNLRFHAGNTPDASNAKGQNLSGTHFPATGPSSRAVKFAVGTTRLWGVGLLPLGWAKFIGTPARDLADTLVDGTSHPAYRRFAPLARDLFGAQPDELGELARITEFFNSLTAKPIRDEARILAIHKALIDPEVATVSQLVERSIVSPRTLERVCTHAFGFAPKLLLRRQRFMRSVTQFLLDPSLRWIGALDGHYHDQAQFVREFRQFIGMTPRQYAALPHPIIDVFMRERLAFAGAAVQALDGPAGGGA